MPTPPPKPPVTWNDTDASQVIPPRTSGAAIASCIVAIVALAIGWIPGCGSIPGIVLAAIALVLAVAARRTARLQPDANRTLPAVDLGLGALALVVSLVATGLTIVRVVEPHDHTAHMPPMPEEEIRQRFEANPADVPGQEAVWLAMNDAGEATYGFLIDAATDPASGSRGIYAVTPTLIFNEDSESWLAPPAPDDDPSASLVPLGSMIWDSTEIRVSAVNLLNEGPPPFAFAGRLPVGNDRVTILTPSETIGGVVTDPGSAHSAMLIELDRPMQAPVPPARATTQPTTQPTTQSTTQPTTQATRTPTTGPTGGTSAPPDLALGCPVILDVTGTVIGSAMGSHPDDPNRLVFAEHLLWPLHQAPAGPAGIPGAAPPAPPAPAE